MSNESDPWSDTAKQKAELDRLWNLLSQYGLDEKDPSFYFVEPHERFDSDGKLVEGFNPAYPFQMRDGYGEDVYIQDCADAEYWCERWVEHYADMEDERAYWANRSVNGVEEAETWRDLFEVIRNHVDSAGVLALNRLEEELDRAGIDLSTWLEDVA